MKTKCFIPTHRLILNRSAFSFLKLPAVLLTAAFALVVTGTSVRASDPICVFAKIDKVVLEPNDSSPDRIQLWGSFCVADSKDNNSYLPPQKGYLYYKLPETNSEAARTEWNDLKAVAGSGDVIGFGSRRVQHPKLRDAKEKPENPDPYSVGFGLVKANQRSASYGPIKALQSEKKSSAPKTKSN